MAINLDSLTHPTTNPVVSPAELALAQLNDATARGQLSNQIQALSSTDDATALLITALQQQDIVTNAERLLMQSQLTALQADVKRRGRIIPFEGNASATQTFLGDATNPSTEWEIGWEGSNRMGRLRTKPGSDIGWFDITIIKVDGNSTTIRVSADDISSQENVWKYFSTSGNLDTNFSHENYSAVSQVFAVAESNSTKSFLHMVFHSGNTNHLTGTIRIHNISDLI